MLQKYHIIHQEAQVTDVEQFWQKILEETNLKQEEEWVCVIKELYVCVIKELEVCH